MPDYAEGHELLCTSCSQENHSRYQYFINTYRSQSCTNSSFLKGPVCALLISHTTRGVKLRRLDENVCLLFADELRLAESVVCFKRLLKTYFCRLAVL